MTTTQTAPFAVGDVVRARRDREAHGPIALIGRTRKIVAIRPWQYEDGYQRVVLDGVSAPVSSYWLELVPTEVRP